MAESEYRNKRFLPVSRFRHGEWECIDDVVSVESSLSITWNDSLLGDGGTVKLWAWPEDPAPLALGHVLLDVRPSGGTLSRQSEVTMLAEGAYLVRLGAEKPDARPMPEEKIRGEMLFEAMRAFISAEGEWHGTGCFHRAGVFDPAANRLLKQTEDIGRHNCLDRLAGWSALSGTPLTDKVLLTSARITASLCAKALRAGFLILVSRSAVTTAAIAMAEEHAATLVGFARTDEQRFSLFTDRAGRILRTGERL